MRLNSNGNLNAMKCLVFLIAFCIILSIFLPGRILAINNNEIIWSRYYDTDKQNVKGIAFGNGIYIDVGITGLIKSSQDCRNWNITESDTTSTLNDVVWNGACFVAVGADGTILRSEDGIKWSKPESIFKENLASVIWGNGRFIAVGSNGTILVSSDGIAWKLIKTSITDSLTSVIWDSREFISLVDNGRIITSTDGVVWNAQNSNINVNLNGMAYNGEIYVAIANSGIMFISSDLENWKQIDMNIKSDFNKIIWNGKQFAALIQTGEVMVSDDGYTWSRTMNYNSLFTTSALNDILWDGMQYVVAGGGGLTYIGYIYQSPTDINGNKLMINRNLLSTYVVPVIVNSRMLVPADSFLKAIGGTYEFIDDTKTIKAAKNNINVELEIGNNRAKINGRYLWMDVPAQIVDNTPMVPVRFISENFECIVEWDKSTNTALVFQGEN